MPTKNRKATIETAKEVLDAIGSPDQAQAKPPTTETQGGATEPSDGLTEAEKADYQRLLATAETSEREYIEAIVEIRRRRLYREEYDTFDEFVTRRLRKTRQWVTQQTRWLEAVKVLEAATGKKIYQWDVQPGSKAEATELRPLVEDRYGHSSLGDQLTLAQLALYEADQHANAERRKRSARHVREQVARIQFWMNCKERCEDEDLPLSTADQINRIRTALRSAASWSSEVNGLIESAQQTATNEGRAFEDCLREIADALSAARNKEEERQAILKEKKALEAKAQEIEKALTDLDGDDKGENGGSDAQDQRENETPNASQDDSPSASEVKEKLTAKGIFKSTKKPQQPDQQNQGQTDKQEPNAPPSPPTSEVRRSLDSALESLNDAHTGDWPVEDADELDRILAVAEDIEKKVAEITAKAKELLADVEEPEAVSSVD